jgi:hypothetical protein
MATNKKAIAYTWTAQALSSFAFPDKVADLMIHHFALVYRDHLASNPKLLDKVLDFIDTKLNVDSLNNMLRSGDARVLDRVLASREHRETIMSTLLSWRLTPANQLRLANRALSESVATDILNRDDFTDEAKLAAFKRARPGAVADWLVTCTLEDDVVLDTLAGLTTASSTGVCVSSFVEHAQVLGVSRKGLARSFAFSNDVGFQQAACWLPMDVDAQEHLTEFVLDGETSYPTSRQSGLLGLLFNPSLRQDLRGRLWGYVNAQQDERSFGPVVADLYSLGIPEPDSVLNVGQTLNEVTDPAVLELLVVSTTRNFTRNYRIGEMARVATIAQILELLENPSLTVRQRERLVLVLSNHLGDTTHAPRVPVAALNKLAEALASEEMATAHRARRVDTSYGVNQVLGNKRTREQKLKGTKDREIDLYEGYSTSSGPHVPDVIDEQYAQMKIGDTRFYAGAQVGLISRILWDALGDGSDKVSQDAWLTFFDMAASQPTSSYRQVATAAMNLARLGV